MTGDDDGDDDDDGYRTALVATISTTSQTWKQL
jgi:hypothetical protein